MASNHINVSTIAMESLRQLENELVALRLAYRDKTADFNKVGGYAVGESVTVKTRPAYNTDEFTEGGSISTQDIKQSSTSFAVEKMFDISIPWTAREQAMSLDSLSEDVIVPAMQSMAQTLDTYLLSKVWEGRGMYASASLLGSSADIALARREANRQQMSKMNRIGLVNGDLEASMLGTDAFNRFDARADQGVDALTNARIGRLMGVDWMSSENFTDASHTTGSGVGLTKTAPSDTENVIGSTVLTLNAAATGTFNDGDRIYVAGMYRPLIVNGTQATPTAINLTHQIDEVVPGTAAVTVVGGSAQTVNHSGVIFTPDAFAYAMPPLDLPQSKNAYVASANGMSLRIVEDYSITNKTSTLSIDTLIGAKCYDPRKVVVLTDNVT